MGLGRTSYDFSQWYLCYGNLVYYKKGSQIWGNKINWNQLLGANTISANNSTLQIFPNPVGDKIILKSSTAIGDATISVSDVTGKIIYSTVFSGQEKQIAIPFSNAAKGIYFLSAKSTAGVTNLKFVK